MRCLVISHDRPLASILTRRLAWIALGVVLVNLFAVALYYGSDIEALENEVMHNEISNLELSLSSEPIRISERERELFKAYPDNYGFALVHSDGSLIDQENLQLIPNQAFQADLFAEFWLTRLVSAEGQLLVASQKISIKNEPLQLIFVMRSDPDGLIKKALVEEFLKHIWLPMLPIALLLIGTNAFMIRQGLKPVSIAAQWARKIQPGEPAPILAHYPLPSEVLDLVEATQRSLERLNVALAAEKRRAAEAAHALRTPVAVIVARLSALPEGDVTQQLRADVEALSRTIHQLLASSRVDGFELSNESTVDLIEVANKVVGDLAPFAYQKGAELSLKVASAQVMAQASSEAVEMALTNLVENAILHAGAVAIEVTVGPSTTIKVRDHGEGFSTNTQNNMFKAFWRGEGAVPGGAGLGLAIVERLQLSQDGTIAAYNLPEGGAEFVLTYKSQ